MNERQQQLFLWDWSRKRRYGQLGILGLGAGTGAIGGIVFGAAMAWAMTLNGAEARLTDDMAPFFRWLGHALGPIGFLYALAIPAFAFIGVVGANRIWAMQEPLYQSLLAEGARVPAEKPPPLTLKERAPFLIVVGVFVLIAFGLCYGVYYEVSRGNL